MQFYRVVQLILAATVTGNVLLLCVAVLLFLTLRRFRGRAREPETPSGRDRQREKAVREDEEAWRRLQAYNVNDAYGTGDSG